MTHEELIKERNEIAKQMYVRNPLMNSKAVVAADDALMSQMYGDKWDITPVEYEDEKGHPCTTEDGITVVDYKGEQWVRVKVLDECFCIAPHNYHEGDKTEFSWDEAMAAMKKKGLTMMTKKQGHIALAFNDEINDLLRKIGGEVLKGYHWSSTEYSSVYAAYMNFPSGYLGYNTKASSSVARPVSAF